MEERETNEELVREIQARKERGEPAKDLLETLWLQNQGIVTTLTKRFWTENTKDDVKQEAYIALSKAADRFDPARGVLFVSYYGHVLTAHLLREVHKQAAVVSVPDWMRMRIMRYKRLTERFEAEHGRPPTAEEVCAEMKLNREDLDTMQHAARLLSCGSVNVTLEDGETELYEMLEDPDADRTEDVLDEHIAAQSRRILSECLTGLTDRQRETLNMRYSEGMSYKQIGAKLGITAERARQIANEGIGKVKRNPTFMRKLEDVTEDVYARSYARHVLPGADRRSAGNTEQLAIEHIRKEEILYRCYSHRVTG